MDDLPGHGMRPLPVRVEVFIERLCFGVAEKHFRPAIELSENGGDNFILANALIWYASLLVKMKRPHEAVAMYERRLAMKRFENEDRLERRCTAEHLATLKAEFTALGPE
jgi:hypothetical protein